MRPVAAFTPQEQPFEGAETSALRFLTRHWRVRGGKAALRLAYKAACRPVCFAAWISDLEGFRNQFGLDETGLHHYAAAPLRPFLRVGLTFEQKVRIARSHHVVIGEALSRPIVRNIWTRRPTKLGVIKGRRGSSFALWLASAEYSREGALEITVTREALDGANGLPLARVTFSLAETEDTGNYRALLIGGLQGGSHATCKRAIIETTRDLRGLRPKTAVLIAVQAFAKFAGCRALLSVSDDQHVINLQNPSTKQRKSASYDSFWLERGGTPHDFLGFALPLGLPERDELRLAVVDCVKTAFPLNPRAA